MLRRMLVVTLVVLASAAGSGAADSRTATLGGGCFWCLEAVFERLQGVEEVVSGYAGGTTEDPTYREVSSGRTGHAEVVRVRFDPGVISYRDLLEIFFAMHDPTTLNRQGADEGTQYRSIILYESEDQRKAARAVMDELARDEVFPRPIVTQLEPARSFYAAESHHQDYYEKNPSQGYCRVVIAPKVNKLRERYSRMLKPAAGE